jgi:hypothetical protein
MFRQYLAAGCRRGGPNPLRLGVVEVSDGFYLQDDY